MTEKMLRTSALPLAGWALVSADSYPTIHSAFDSISHDNGYGCNTVYSVPPEWVAQLQYVEKALANLDSEELLTFAIGDQDVAESMVNMHPGLGRAHEMLEQFWNDWGYSEDSAPKGYRAHE